MEDARLPDHSVDAITVAGAYHWFDNTLHQSFGQFCGGMSSASYAPEAGTVAGKAFREAIQALFEKYAVNKRIVTMWRQSAAPVRSTLDGQKRAPVLS